MCVCVHACACVCVCVCVLPSAREVGKALGKLKNEKASNILPEMLKAGRRDEGFVSMLTDLISTVWEERQVPNNWVDAILVPIPKKGNLHSSDSWRGIALLDVVGKLVAGLRRVGCKSWQRERVTRVPVWV